MTSSVELGTTPKLLVILSTGRNQISKVSIKLSAPFGVRFEYRDAILDDNGEILWYYLDGTRDLRIGLVEAELVAANDCISLQKIAKDTSVSILLPHSDASAFHAMVCLFQPEKCIPYRRIYLLSESQYWCWICDKYRAFYHSNIRLVTSCCHVPSDCRERRRFLPWNEVHSKCLSVYRNWQIFLDFSRNSLSQQRPTNMFE